MFYNNKSNVNFFTIIIVYLVICAAFIISVRNYTSSSLESEKIKVQSHVSNMMDIRAGAVNKWIKDKEAAINSISENLTVRIYLATIQDESATREDILTHNQFTAAYLSSVASESGFKQKKIASDDDIKANVKEESDSALILFDASFKPTISVGFAENLNEVIGNYNSLGSNVEISFIKSEENKSFYLKIVKKIKKLQEEEVVGYIVAIKKLDDELFDLIEFPPSEYKTSITQIVHKNGTMIEFISKSADDSSVIEMEDNLDMAEIYAVNNPNIISLKTNSKDEDIFVSARDIGHGGIYLIHSILYSEALGETLNNSKNINIISYLICLLLAGIMALVWKHSISEKYKKLHSQVRQKQKLLQLITENQIQSMFLLDKENKVVFANKKFMKKNKIKFMRSKQTRKVIILKVVKIISVQNQIQMVNLVK
jgi:hypothetical protein